MILQNSRDYSELFRQTAYHADREGAEMCHVILLSARRSRKEHCPNGAGDGSIYPPPARDRRTSAVPKIAGLIALQKYQYQRIREAQACVPGNPHQSDLNYVTPPPFLLSNKHYKSRVLCGVAHVSVLVGVEIIHGSVELLIG